MTTLPVMEPPGEADPKAETARRLAEAVGRNVLAALGRPHDLYHVAALPLWGKCHRVNVLTGPDAVSVRVSDSFFVSADDRGNVLQSTPAITRKYPPTGSAAY